MDLVKKKKIKTLNELNTFNVNKAEIRRQLGALGLEEESFTERFQRELDILTREHERRLKRIKNISRVVWALFAIGMALQIIALILKIK